MCTRSRDTCHIDRICILEFGRNPNFRDFPKKISWGRGRLKPMRNYSGAFRMRCIENRGGTFTINIS